MKVLVGIAVCFLASLMVVDAQASRDRDAKEAALTRSCQVGGKKINPNSITGAEDYQDMECKCVSAVRVQIQMEMDASLAYLALGAHFSLDTINRPGFAKLFFGSASEEREHCTKLIEYLLMRGELTTELSSLLKVAMPKDIDNNTSGQQALTAALTLETQVTENLRHVIQVCESDKKNHYHLVDYLTGVYLEEQYHGQRDLAEKIKTLERMEANKGTLAEFLFDKTL